MSHSDLHLWRVSKSYVWPIGGFSSIEDLIDNQRGIAFLIEYDTDTQSSKFISHYPLSDLSNDTLHTTYLLSYDNSTISKTVFSFYSHISNSDSDPSPTIDPLLLNHVSLSSSTLDTVSTPVPSNSDPFHLPIPDPVSVNIKVKKTYKPVTKKVRPVQADLPE